MLAPSESAAKLYQKARLYIGTPYVHWSNSEQLGKPKFDCIDLIRSVIDDFNGDHKKSHLAPILFPFHETEHYFLRDLMPIILQKNILELATVDILKQQQFGIFIKYFPRRRNGNYHTGLFFTHYNDIRFIHAVRYQGVVEQRYSFEEMNYQLEKYSEQDTQLFVFKTTQQ